MIIVNWNNLRRLKFKIWAELTCFKGITILTLTFWRYWREKSYCRKLLRPWLRFLRLRCPFKVAASKSDNFDSLPCSGHVFLARCFIGNYFSRWCRKMTRAESRPLRSQVHVDSPDQESAKTDVLRYTVCTQTPFFSFLTLQCYIILHTYSRSSNNRANLSGMNSETGKTSQVPRWTVFEVVAHERWREET